MKRLLDFKLYNNNVDLIAFAGDAVHDDGTKYDYWATFWDEHFKATSINDRLIPMIYTLGNHDGVVNDEYGEFKNLLWDMFGATEDNVVFHYNFFSNLNAEGWLC